MIPPALHADESARLIALRSLGLLDSAPEQRFDRLVRLACTTMGTPIALVTLVDEDRLWFKARAGLDVDELPRAGSFCDHAVAVAEPGRPFVVEDAERDERFADHALVLGAPHVRFYAAHVLRDIAGQPVGTFSVLDTQPRFLAERDLVAFADLAELVEAELGRTRADDLLAQLDAARRTAEIAGDRLRLAAQASGVGTAFLDANGIVLFSNPAFDEVLGRSGEELLGRSIDAFLIPGDEERAAIALEELRANRRDKATYEGSILQVADDQEPRWARAHRSRLSTADGDDAQLMQIEDITAQRLLEAELRRSEAASRTALDALDQGVLVVDSTGEVTRINPAATRLLGYDATEITELWRSGDWPTYEIDGRPMPVERRPVFRSVATRQAVRGEIVGWRRKDGERTLFRLSCVPIEGGEGRMVLAFTDVTDEHRSRSLLDATLETAPVGLVVLDIDRRIVRCNSMFAAHSGRPAAELLGLDITDLLGDEPDRAEAQANAAAIVANKAVGAPRRPARRVVRPDGSERWITSEIAIIPDPDQPRAIVATFDVTEERKLNLELSRFEYLFRHANDIITVVDADGTVLYASPSNGRVLGYPEDWAHPQGILGLVHPDDAAMAAGEFDALVAGTRGAEPFTLRVRAANGEWRHLECVGVNLLDEPAVGGIVLTSRDTTDRERLTARLAHSATHDDLTDLANRTLLESQLNGALARAIRDDRRVGLCFIDLDGFKGVNDSCGHAVGDQLLLEVARRIRGAIRGGDLAARIGGDEFVVMIDPVSGSEEAMAAATRIRDAIVVDMDEIADGLRCGASVGVAVSAIDDTPSSLLRRADTALYRAKSMRRSAIEIATEPAY